MPKFRRMPLPWTTIFTDRTDTDGDFNPCSAWMKAEDVGRMRVTFEVRNTTDSSGVIKLGYQTANVENSPDAAVVPGAPLNSQTGDGMSYPSGLFDLAAATSAKQLVRFGWFFLASSSGLKAARVAGVLEFEDCA